MKNEGMPQGVVRNRANRHDDFSRRGRAHCHLDTVVHEYLDCVAGKLPSADLLNHSARFSGSLDYA
jgi:hypothetical protein